MFDNCYTYFTQTKAKITGNVFKIKPLPLLKVRDKELLLRLRSHCIRKQYGLAVVANNTTKKQ